MSYLVTSESIGTPKRHLVQDLQAPNDVGGRKHCQPDVPQVDHEANTDIVGGLQSII